MCSVPGEGVASPAVLNDVEFDLLADDGLVGTPMVRSAVSVTVNLPPRAVFTAMVAASVKVMIFAVWKRGSSSTTTPDSENAVVDAVRTSIPVWVLRPAPVHSVGIVWKNASTVCQAPVSMTEFVEPLPSPIVRHLCGRRVSLCVDCSRRIRRCFSPPYESERRQPYPSKKITAFHQRPPLVLGQ